MAILKHKDLVDTIFLECTELDKESNRSQEVLLDNEVLLSANLAQVR